MLETFNHAHGTNIRLGPRVIDRLKRCDIPGNVRELINVMERMMIMCENGCIGTDDLPEEIQDFSCAPQSLDMEGLTLKESVRRLEMQLIRNALEISDSPASAAALLDIHPTTLWRKMTRYETLQK